MLNLNFKFKQCKKEFDDGNFEGALKSLECIKSDDSDYKFALMLKYNCLMGLECYHDALSIINLLISENPYVLLLWFDKVKCHYFLDDLDSSINALNHAERLVDFDDFDEIICFVKLCNMVGEYEIALKYCNFILDIDKTHVDALLEKSLIVTILNDKDMMNDCGNKLLEVCDGTLSSLMVPFALKLFSGRYKDCFDVILKISRLDLKMCEILKKVLYTQMLCDLDIQIWMDCNVGLSIDESINLLMDYHYEKIEFGEIRDVKFIIIKQS